MAQSCRCFDHPTRGLSDKRGTQELNGPDHFPDGICALGAFLFLKKPKLAYLDMTHPTIPPKSWNFQLLMASCIVETMQARDVWQQIHKVKGKIFSAGADEKY